MSTQARWWALGALALSMLTIGLDTDLVGVVLSSAGVTSLTFGFIRAGLQSWSHALVWVPIAAGAALLSAFVVWQLRCRHPLVDIALFRAPAFRWGTALSTLMGMSMFGVLFALPLFYQAVQGNSTLGTGVRLLPLIVGLVVGTRIVDRISDRVGTPTTIALGFGVTAASLAGGALTTATTSFAVIATWLSMVFVGMGLVMPTALGAALGALEPSRAGSGSALIQALRQAGGTIGVALLGTVINAGYRGAVPIVPDAAGQARIDESVSSGMAVARDRQAGSGPGRAIRVRARDVGDAAGQRGGVGGAGGRRRGGAQASVDRAAPRAPWTAGGQR